MRTGSARDAESRTLTLLDSALLEKHARQVPEVVLLESRYYTWGGDDASELQIIKAENCSKDLKKRLKMKALEREIDLQDLILEYCEQGLEREEAEKTKKRKA